MHTCTSSATWPGLTSDRLHRRNPANPKPADEEVQAEALTRNLEGFSRFFDVICALSGEFIDFTKFASRASIVEPFTKSAGRRLGQRPRYYLFDVGVLNGALRNFEVSADRVLVTHPVRDRS